MKQEIITISSAVVLGALSRGLTGTMTESSSNTVRGVVNAGVAIGAGVLAVRVKGTDSKSAFLRGSALGVSIAHGLEVIKNIASSPKFSAKLDPSTKMGRFLQKSAGLSGAVNGLDGFVDAYGNYREDGLGGYIDSNGNYIQDQLNGYIDANGVYREDGLGAIQDDSLAGYIDENGNYKDGGLSAYDDGLGAYDDGLGAYDDGLGAYDEGLGALYDEGLGAYVDSNGNYIL